ncbi:MAG: hypothetical protein ACI857_001659 [Arenicella sp.]
MMRALLLAIFLGFVISPITFGQTINSFEIIPANPTTEDTVKLAYDIWTSSGAVYQYDTVIVNGFTIDVSSCIHLGLTTEGLYFIDTIVIGVLPQGNYNINYSCYFDGAGDCSSPDFTASDSSNFNASAPLNLASQNQEKWSIWFDGSHLNFEGVEIGLQDNLVYLIDASGRIILKTEFQTNRLAIPQLERGVYQVVVVNSNELLHLQKILITPF